MSDVQSGGIGGIFDNDNGSSLLFFFLLLVVLFMNCDTFRGC